MSNYAVLELENDLFDKNSTYMSNKFDYKNNTNIVLIARRSLNWLQSEPLS